MTENRMSPGGIEQGGRWQARGWSSRGRGGRGGRGNRNRKPQNASRFTGASSKMLGHVFQVNEEQRKRGQFKETVNTLKMCASENVKKDVRAMETLFGDNIAKPEIKSPASTR